MKKKTKDLVLFAILTAILVLMAFTPIGYLRVGVVEITFMMIPVIIGAAACGPLVGAGLGLVFGVTSFAQCFGISAFGTLLFSLQPYFTAILCIVPRVLFGLIAGFLYKGFRLIKKMPVAVCDGLTMLLGAIIHTALFVVLFYFFFGKADAFAAYGNDFFTIVWALVGVNGIVEWCVCLFIGTAILNAVRFFFDRKPVKKNKHYK